MTRERWTNALSVVLAAIYGFAGIANPLFAADNTLMLFADGKEAVMEITKAVKAG